MQHIPATPVAQMAGVPSSLLGLRGKAGNVVADRYYQADNTFWVDPRTGVLIDIEQRILSVLRGPNGQGQLVVADADLKMSGSSQRQLAALATQERRLDAHAADHRPVRRRHPRPYPHPRRHDPVPPRPETRAGQLNQIDREMQFDGELTDEQHAGFPAIAERCPVHRTLHSEVIVSTAEIDRR